MTKAVQMSIEIPLELHDQFLIVAEDQHRSAAEIIRELMCNYLANYETPNALTIETLRKSDNNEEVFYAADAADLFKQLGI